MLQPGSGLAGRADDYRWWAADNGCFSQGAAFDVSAWFSWLASLPHVGRRPRCLFAVPPEVLGDAATTCGAAGRGYGGVGYLYRPSSGR